MLKKTKFYFMLCILGIFANSGCDVDTGAVSVVNYCEEGALRCDNSDDGYFISKCIKNDNGYLSWSKESSKDSEKCSGENKCYYDDNSTPYCGECVDGAKKCMENSLYMCINGKYDENNKIDCQYACQVDRCTECKPENEDICYYDGTEYHHLRCNENGKFVERYSGGECEDSEQTCNGDSCKVIEGVARYCENGNYKVCPDNVSCNASGTCGACKDGTITCENDEKGYGVLKTCISGMFNINECSNGSCAVDGDGKHGCGLCKNETSECVDDNSVHTCKNGAWGESEQCSNGCNAETGKCEITENECNRECGEHGNCFIADDGTSICKCVDGYEDSDSGCVEIENNCSNCSQNQICLNGECHDVSEVKCNSDGKLSVNDEMLSSEINGVRLSKKGTYGCINNKAYSCQIIPGNTNTPYVLKKFDDSYGCANDTDIFMCKDGGLVKNAENNFCTSEDKYNIRSCYNGQVKKIINLKEKSSIDNIEDKCSDGFLEFYGRNIFCFDTVSDDNKSYLYEFIDINNDRNVNEYKGFLSRLEVGCNELKKRQSNEVDFYNNKCEYNYEGENEKITFYFLIIKKQAQEDENKRYYCVGQCSEEAPVSLPCPSGEFKCDGSNCWCRP